MAEVKVQYRVSTAAFIAGGFVALSLGGTLYTYDDFLWSSLVGAVRVIIGLAGAALMVVGIVRAVRERREQETPSD